MKIKKMLAAILSLSLFCGMSTLSASAADMNSAEQQLMDYFESVKIQGQTIPQEYLNQAENWFLSDDVNITEAQKNNAMEPMKAAEQELIDSGVKHWKDLTLKQQKSLVAYAEKACDAVGLKFIYNWQTGEAKIVDQDGNVIVSIMLTVGQGIIKTTGEKNVNYWPAVAVAGALLVLIGAAFIIAKKKKLFASAE